MKETCLTLINPLFLKLCKYDLGFIHLISMNSTWRMFEKAAVFT